MKKRMDEHLEELFSKKSPKGHELTPDAAQAKADVLHELMSMAHNAMGDKVGHGMEEMRKVSVMAPNKSGLMAGLDKAKELTSDAEEQEHDLHSPEHETSSHSLQKETPEAKMHSDAMEKAEEMLGEDLDHDNEEGEPLEHVQKMEQAKHDKTIEHDKTDTDREQEAEEESLFNAKRKKDKKKSSY